MGSSSEGGQTVSVDCLSTETDSLYSSAGNTAPHPSSLSADSLQEGGSSSSPPSSKGPPSERRASAKRAPSSPVSIVPARNRAMQMGHSKSPLRDRWRNLVQLGQTAFKLRSTCLNLLQLCPSLSSFALDKLPAAGRSLSLVPTANNSTTFSARTSQARPRLATQSQISRPTSGCEPPLGFGLFWGRTQKKRRFAAAELQQMRLI